MRIAVPKETYPGESRVAVTPDVVKRLVREGHSVVVESDAGAAGGFLDGAYVDAGATIATSPTQLVENADVIAHIHPPKPLEIGRMPLGSLVVSFLWPTANEAIVQSLCDHRVNAFAMDRVPRITRAQSMDALSSMSTIAGYRAALIAAQHLGKFFPMLMTAAGTIPPARVVVIGVGVAGLQAIATCRRLGAIVEASDIRQEALEQARSLGAETIDVELGESGEGEGGYARELSKEARERQAAKLAERIRVADAVITTALVPGRPAPRLVSTDVVDSMKPGSVLIDLAAEAGGNCELTEAGKAIERNGVTIVGLVNLPATMASDGSRMYAKNIQEIVRHLTPPKGEADESPTGVHIDFDDEITAGSIYVYDGKVRRADADNKEQTPVTRSETESVGEGA